MEATRGVEDAIRLGLPFGRFEFKDVVFAPTAHGDTPILHSLSEGAPKDVEWMVLGWEFMSIPSDPPYAYRSLSPAAKEFTRGVIYLRCNIASAKAKMLLFQRA